MLLASGFQRKGPWALSGTEKQQWRAMAAMVCHVFTMAGTGLQLGEDDSRSRPAQWLLESTSWHMAHGTSSEELAIGWPRKSL